MLVSRTRQSLGEHVSSVVLHQALGLNNKKSVSIQHYRGNADRLQADINVNISLKSICIATIMLYT